MLDVPTVRLLASLMAAGAVAAIVASIRWERAGGKRPKLRAATPSPRHVRVSWPIVQAVPLLYPFLVALVPTISYGTILHFSPPLVGALQVLGSVLWGLGAFLLVWCSRVLGPIMTVDGVVENHKLITTGPYARVRHPTYAAFVVVAIGAAMAFLSYVLVAFAVATLVLVGTLARSEERLLSSTQGFGDEYRAYMARTGRFLPRFGSRP